MKARQVFVGILLTVFFIFLLLYGPGLHVRGTEGSVGELLNPDDPPEQWRYRPMSGASVLVMWRGAYYTPGHGVTRCIRAARLTTDATGRFHAADWWRMPALLPIGPIDTWTFASSDGYARAAYVDPPRGKPPQIPDDVLLLAPASKVPKDPSDPYETAEDFKRSLLSGCPRLK